MKRILSRAGCSTTASAPRRRLHQALVALGACVLMLATGQTQLAQAAIAPALPAAGIGLPAPTPQWLVADEAVTSAMPAVAAAPQGETLPVGADPGAGRVRLPGHVLPLLAQAQPALPFTMSPYSPEAYAAQQELTLTLVLKRDDQAGFERYMREVYDPHSRRYRHFLTQDQLTRRYGPSRQAYGQLRDYLAAQGLRAVEQPRNRMTLSVRGSRARVEQALALRIGDYQMRQRAFYAADSDPALPVALARHVQSIGGLSNLARPAPAHNAIAELFAITLCTIPFSVGYAFGGGFNSPPGVDYDVYPPYLKALGKCISTLYMAFAYGKDSNNTDPPAPTWKALDGTGQTVGLLEFDTFNKQDVADWLALTGAPASEIDNLSVVPVNGGVAAPGSGESEVLVDIDTVMAIAPGAKVAVYDAPFNGQASSYTALYNAMINGGVSIISSSWASCEDQVSQAEAQGIDTVLQSAAASGISVFNGTGDSGSTCLDGGANTAPVPADSPSATAVGGSSLTVGPGFSYGSETWWDGTGATPPTGQGGYSTSRYFAKPGYQSSLNSSSMRSIPDVVANANPLYGIVLCQADSGGCPNGTLNGGTSMAAPEWAGFAALLNQGQGQNLGAFNPLLYPLAGSAAFHDAASMNSDFSHVGLGSPNLDILHTQLSGQAVGAISATDSIVSTLVPEATSGAGVVDSSGVPDDGTKAYVVVRLVDANGLYGYNKTVSLSASSASASISPASINIPPGTRSAVFTVTDTAAETVTFTATDSSDSLTLATQPTLTFGAPTATAAGLSVFPTSVTADGSSAATLVVTLKDAQGNPTPGKLIQVSQGSGQSVISGPQPAVTDSTGTIQFTATDDIDETVTYTATDVSDGNLPIPGSGTTVTFGSASASDCNSNPAVAASGYTLTNFATGFPGSDFFYSNINFGGCPGAVNPYFPASGVVLIPDFETGDIYKLGSQGGAVTSGDVLTNLGPSIGTPVYGADGSLYAARFATGAGFTTGDIIQIDPSSGAILRELANNLTCPNSLTVDPLSGDLFFDDQCFGGGSDNASLWRLSNPAGATPTVSVYATLPNGGGEQQIAFAPNGTIYAVSGGDGNTTSVVQISGTNGLSPATMTTLPVLAPDNGSIAVGETNADGSAKTLLLHQAGDNGGTLATWDITGATPTLATVYATGDIGAGIVGPDGCYYVGTHHLVYKLAPSSGVCTLTPTSPGPSLTLGPATVTPNPVQGGKQSFTAVLKNAATLAGVPIVFRVSGANPQMGLVSTDASGQAVFSYTAINAGSDTVVAKTSMPASPGSQQGGVVKQGRPYVMRPSRAVTGTAHAGRGPVPGARYRTVTAAAAKPVAHATQATTTTSSGIGLVSNPAQVTWTGGPHVTYLTLNPSASGGIAGQAVTVAAALIDLSASPAGPLASQSVSFTVGGASCSGSTNAQGVASCSLTPAATGDGTLTAKFAGTSQLAATQATESFKTMAAPSSSSSSGGSSSSSSSSSSSGGGSGGGGGGGSPAPELLLLGSLAALLRRRQPRRNAGRRGER